MKFSQMSHSKYANSEHNNKLGDKDNEQVIRE